MRKNSFRDLLNRLQPKERIVAPEAPAGDADDEDPTEVSSTQPLPQPETPTQPIPQAIPASEPDVQAAEQPEATPPTTTDVREPVPLPEAGQDEPVRPPFLTYLALWLASGLLLFRAVLDLPSTSSLALIAAAVVACPAINLLGLLAKPFKRISPQATVSPTVEVLIACALAALGLVTTPSQGQPTLQSFIDFQRATLNEPAPVEYANQPVDPTTLLTCSNPSVTVSSKDPVNASLVGMQELAIDLTMGPFHRSQNVVFVVRDTQPPQIKVAEKTVTASLGKKFDPSANLTVTDPVDGKLTQVKEQPQAGTGDIGQAQLYEEGWFMVQSDVDTKTPGTYTVSVTACDQHGNQATGSYQVLVEDPLASAQLTQTTTVLEYSQKKADATKLVSCSVDGVEIKADKLDLSQVGPLTVTYTLSKGGSSQTVDLAFEVRDTKAPTVKVAQSAITITAGDSFDPYANVSQVSDPVDGDLPRVDARPAEHGEGWYTVEGNYDTSTDGIYYLTVVACDRNGNETSKEFTLTVNDPAPALPADGGGAGGAAAIDTGDGSSETGMPQIDTAKDYVLNTNTHKFHRPSCRYVEEIADHNRWDVHMDRQEVIDMDYQPCKVCDP